MFTKPTNKLAGLNLFLAGTIGILVFNAWFLNHHFTNLRKQEERVKFTADVIRENDLFLSAMKDVETGFRGYAVTSDPVFLEPYDFGRTDAWDHFAKLDGLIGGQEKNRVWMAEIKESTKERFKKFEDGIEQLRRGKKLDNAFYRSGKQTMDQLRQQTARIKDQESSVLQAFAKDAEGSRIFFEISLFVTTLLAILVIGFGYTQIRKFQIRGFLENLAKSRDALLKSRLAALQKIIVGDVTSKQVIQGVLDYLAELAPVLGGNFYTYNNGFLVWEAGLAQDKNQKAPARVGLNQDLLGESFRQKEVNVVKSIPENYFQISSSMGKSSPKNLIFIPVQFQGRNIAIIEAATFENLDEEILAFLEQAREVMGVGLNAAQSRENLQELLEKTQMQAEELQTQQEELRTNNEELEQQARALESQQQAMAIKNKELEQAQSSIEIKARDLELASQYKSEFLAKMSHELRTPLNSLLILSTLLIENKENNLTGQQKEFSKSIYDAGNDLLNLINDILDLSKIEARKLAIRPEKISVQALTQTLKSTFAPQALTKGLEFKIDIADAAKNTEIFTDRQRLEQILRNFLSNAFKFTEKGSITLKVWPTKGKNTLSIGVIDTGIGIHNDKKESVFDAFEQADSSISRNYGGTGLGLTISRELAYLLGGQIILESRLGVGSQFTLELPLETQFAEQTPEKNIPLSAPTAEQHTIEPDYKEEVLDVLKKIGAKKKTILIIEDDAGFRSSVAEAALSYGFDPIEISRGDVAMEVLKQHTPAAVLLDIKLPGISGMGLLEFIKKQPHLRHIPTHMISGVDYQQNALRMGAMGYLGKPVTLDKVRSALGRIENLLSQKMKRILIVEDDDLQRESIKKLVSGKDLEILTARRGQEALTAMKEKGFDCIILDLSLPDMTGFEFLEKLNKMDASLPPIVIYTGKDLSREEEEYLRKFSESIIIKGAKSPDRLLDEVNLFLHRMESFLPQEQQQMLNQLRTRDKSLEGKTILLVDDDLRNIFALTSALESYGLVVKVARNGQEALDNLNVVHPELVLMDIMMPKMDGFEATRRIRQMKEYKDLPIIALTAKAMKEDHDKCIEAGANDYLPKPINLLNLMSVLKVWLPNKGIFK